MNINKLHDAWITAGQNYTDKQSNVQNMAIALANGTKDYTDEEIQNAKKEMNKAKQARDLAKDALDSATESKKLVEPTKPVAETPDEHHVFANGVRDLMSGKIKVLNLVSSSSDNKTTSGAGLTIPEDIETRINKLIRQFDVLQPLVNVESVSTVSGSRVIEQFSLMTPLASIEDEDADIADNDEPKLATVNYTIKRYAGINKITDSLLKDSDENIITWLTTWIARKVVVTRNQAIITVLNAAPKKATITKVDDIKDLDTGTLDPAINRLGYFLTNNSGFNTLKKIKDAMGRYLLQPDVAQAGAFTFDGKRIVVVSDNWLPDVSKDTHPLYFGSFADAVTLFDRENMSLATTTEGGKAFEKDQTWIRVIDRFDVEMIDDGAMAVGSFGTIEDQPANLAPKA
ncbi:phage major capsid protein [Secundilactobacillus kimchicus]|uniref:phage major capsid protein n=1 Tax=Secundilactobacillus kimchicus TaxID=528209 RepID=UPI001C019953|nr:phage major capsid protein [Secundilactobacillus kimchicus]MBT9670689.1 phage major capsid protein [Secundilactobacillus kimchicus]